jgi:hypothetical protein
MEKRISVNGAARMCQSDDAREPLYQNVPSALVKSEFLATVFIAYRVL